MMYLLGYDASCAGSGCRRVAERVRGEVGELLTVVPLQSADMARYRFEVFGADAPWAPTLVKVDRDDVEAWTGWRMGPALAGAIGVANSVRVLSVVGQEQPGRTPALFRHVGRRPFLRFAAGTVIGVATLSGFSAPASAAPAQRGSNATILQGRDVAASSFEMLQTRDAELAFAGFDPPDTVAREAARGTARFHPMSSADEQGGTAVAVYDVERDLLYSAHQEMVAGTIVASWAAVYRLSPDNTTFRLLSRSVNGELPSPVAEQALTESVLAGQDPCGGCNGPGGPGDMSRRTTTQCVEDVDVACALGLAGCIGCGAPCIGVTGPAAGTCAFCLIVSCGGFFAGGGCCTDDGAVQNVCFRCNPPL